MTRCLVAASALESSFYEALPGLAVGRQESQETVVKAASRAGTNACSHMALAVGGRGVPKPLSTVDKEGYRTAAYGRP